MSDRLIDDRDQRLIAAIQGGFPLVPRPFRVIGEQIGMTEADVLEMLRDLKARGVIKRLGIIVRHRELGYSANAMVVWDVPDADVVEVGKRVSAFDFVSLCYQRKRALPRWPYNLYCMIHGRERQMVLNNLNDLVSRCGLRDISRQVLFSQRRFKQCGAHYFQPRAKDP